MNIVDTIAGIQPFDWAVSGFIVVMFILGFAQGAIRRLLGIASIAFSFLLAANLRDGFGAFLAGYWVQWPAEYSYMLALGSLFVVGSVIFAIVIQSFYKHAPLFARYQILDELLGGVLGILQALIIVGAVIITLDSFFRLPVAIGEQQIQFLKDVYGAVDASATARLFREELIPFFVAVVGPLLPSDIQALYPLP